MPCVLSLLQPNSKTNLTVPGVWIYLKTRQPFWGCGSWDSRAQFDNGHLEPLFSVLRDRSRVLELEVIMQITQTSGFQTGSVSESLDKLLKNPRHWAYARSGGAEFSGVGLAVSPDDSVLGGQWSGLTSLGNKGLQRWDCVSWRKLGLIELNDLSKGWLVAELAQNPYFLDSNFLFIPLLWPASLEITKFLPICE